MKINKNIYKLLIVVLFIASLGFGCGAKTPMVAEEYHEQGEQSQEERGKINLLNLPDDRKVIPLENPKAGSIVGKTVIVETEVKPEDSVYQLIEDIPDEIDSLNSQAYRVQIFSSKVFGESRQTKKVAEEIFDRPVFMDYEVPYYKIRVGNFSNREKAEEYQLRAKSAGYTNAWVVVVIVNIKETSPLYDEMLPELIDSLIIEEENENSDNESDESEE